MKRILCFCFASRLDRRLLNQLGPTGEEEEVGPAEAVTVAARDTGAECNDATNSTQKVPNMEALQLCSHDLIGWLDAPSGLFERHFAVS